MTTLARPHALTTPDTHAAAARVTWPLLAVVFASTSAVVGVMWDISWHRTIGRDTFFTPAHLAIYLGGIVAGLTCGWVVLKTTWAGTDAERAAGVRFWGFTGPLGAWVCIWGAFAMITSGPFDDWWHNAYGLDVEILSPPHTVLALGIITIQVGAMLMALARQNTAGPHGGSQVLFGYAAGLLVLFVAVLTTEYTSFANYMHADSFYQVSALVFPLFLVSVARASRSRWGATLSAAVYMAVTMLMIWVLQLFPAQPLLGPIYNPVDHMVPPAFPMLLVVPALAVDLLARHLPHRGWRAWRTAAAIGIAFVSILLVVQWFFADFLLSPAARNFFFGADQWDYNVRLGPWRYEYWGATATVGGLLVAAGIASLTSRMGLAWGNWMTNVRR